MSLLVDVVIWRLGVKTMCRYCGLQESRHYLLPMRSAEGGFVGASVARYGEADAEMAAFLEVAPSYAHS